MISTKPISKTECSLCLIGKRMFEPQIIFCVGKCQQRLRRNSFYYSNITGKLNWCHPCYSELPSKSNLDGQTVVKSSLIKRKNNNMVEESWVCCDTPNCGEWVHQICGLFNGRKNESMVPQEI